MLKCDGEFPLNAGTRQRLPEDEAAQLFCYSMIRQVRESWPEIVPSLKRSPMVRSWTTTNMNKTKEQKADDNSFPKIACIAIGAVIGLAVFKGLGIGGAIGGGLGGFLGACVGELVYKSALKGK